MSYFRVSSRSFLCSALWIALAAPALAGVPAPSFSKVFSPDTIGPGSVSTLTFTIVNNDATFPLDDMAFTDTLPAGVTIADPANASTDCAGAVLSAPDGGGTISFSDGDLGASATCTVTVDVTSSTPGTHMNTSGVLTSDHPPSGTASDDLTVDTSLPGFSKSFAPSSVPLGGRSTLTLLIDNSANASSVPNLDFTDALPAGMEIADPAAASTTCGTATIPPTLTAAPGTGVVVLDADGTAGFPAVGAGATCTVTVDVVATGGGALDNVSGDLLAEFVEAGRASATLEVTVTDLAIAKSFTDDPVPPGGTTTLEFRIDNFDRDFPATGVAFSDDLAAILPGTPDVTFDSLLANDCGGTVTGAGTTLIGFSGGTIGPEGFCTIRVRLTVPAGATPGVYTNTSGAVSGTVDGEMVTGNTASDDLFVQPAPVLTKLFVGDPVNAGDDVILRFTVTNTSATSGATDVEFLDELTDGSGGFPPDLTSGFLPFPVSVTLPPDPDPPCGGGSSLALVSRGTDRQALELTGGSLAAAGMSGDSCTFEVTVTIPAGFAPGTYLNTTEEPTATVDGATRVGRPASDDLTVLGAPSLSKAFTDDPVGPGGSVTLEFTLSHPPDAPGDATSISFTDDLDAALTDLAAAAGELPLTGLCPAGDGSLTGTMGDTLLTFSGASLMPGESCTFSLTLDVPAGAAAGSHTNTTSGVSATVAGLAATSAPASDDLEVQGLVFTKEFVGNSAANPALPGETLTLRFTIANVHPTDDATITFFTDNLDAALDDLAATGGTSADTCGGSLSGTTFLTYIGGSVTSGSSCIIEVPVLVPAGAADGTYVNTTSSLSTSLGTIAPAVADLVVDSNLLGLAKAFTDDPVNPGGTVTLRFTLTNLAAGEPASMIDFTDDLAAVLPGTPDLTFDSLLSNDCGATVSGTGTSLITVIGAALGIGGTCTIEVSVGVPGAAAAGVYTNTTSGVTGDVGGFAVSGDAATDKLRIVDLLAFDKSFDGPTTATGTAILTFTITNPTASTASGISFTDDLDDVVTGLLVTDVTLDVPPCGAGSSLAGTGTGFLTFSGGELPPMGGTCSFRVEVTVPVTATAGTYPNVTSELFQSGLPVADPATADLVIEPPPTFAKVFSPNPILAGGVSTLTFTIDNTASALDATGLDFTDTLPAGVVVAATPSASTTCTGGTLTATAGSGTVSYTGGTVSAGTSCTVEVDVSAALDGSYVNTSGDLTSSSGDSGTAGDTLAVGAAADVAVSKTDGVTSATPGESVVYTIVVTNHGPSADPAVVLNDTFPASLSCTFTSTADGGATGNTAAGSGNLSETLSMPAGGSVTYVVTCAIDPGATGTLSNTATAAASVTDLVPGNDSATDDDTVLAPEADLGITKTDSEDPVPAGGALTYTVTVTNDGPSDATGVTVTETLPAGVTFVATSGCDNDPNGVPSCDLGTIAAGDSKQLTVDVTVDAATPSGTITNTVSVASDAGDPDAGDDQASEDTAVDADAPTVTLVDTTPDTGDGELAECEEARVAISELLVTFSESMLDPPGDLGADDVTNPDNYLLVASGPDRDFSTVPLRGVAPACGPALGDDVEVPITGVTYDDGSLTATLALAEPLGSELYRLLACGSSSLQDPAGNALDGDGDGSGGDDFARTFRVELESLLVNSQFDCTIDGWVAVSTVPEEIEYSAEDVDGSSVSGSAGITNLSASEDFSLGQCAPAVAGSECVLAGRLRLDAPGVVMSAAAVCESFPLADCAGAAVGIDASVVFPGDTGGLWDPVLLDLRFPPGAVSTLCSVDLRTEDGEDFDAFLDDVRLTCLGTIFVDGFESGDTAAWSSQNSHTD